MPAGCTLDGKSLRVLCICICYVCVLFWSVDRLVVPRSPASLESELSYYTAVATMTYVCGYRHCRELHQAVILAGFFANEVLARVLKHALRHPRPLASCEALNVCDSYGMPSSHTQCAFFAIGLHAILAARCWASKSAGTKLLEAAEVVGLSLMAPMVAASRVYLGYHSLDQVRAGAALGIFFSIGWGVLLNSLRPVYKRVAGLPLSKFLGIRDTWATPDPLALELGMYSDTAARKKD